MILLVVFRGSWLYRFRVVVVFFFSIVVCVIFVSGYSSLGFLASERVLRDMSIF